MKTPPVIMAADVRIEELLAGIDIAKPTKGKRYKKDHQTGEQIKYLDIVTSFDIETSSAIIPSIHKTQPHAWMYIWQWQFGDRATVIGRYWDEFLVLVYDLNVYLHDMGCRMMVFVHNLSYEFQFLAGIWHFEESDVFATEAHGPLYCKMDHLELRCSARLSGYDLDTWTKTLNVDHQKLVGDLDYKIIRYPWTPLTDQELAYCTHDVIGVVECVLTMLHSYGDTLNSIPYTATGYIRRRVKAAMASWSFGGIRSLQNPLEVYDRMRTAFRGGDTHANRFQVGSIHGQVWSYDRSSSYPDVICHCKFPMTKFKEIEPTRESVVSEIEHGKAVMFKIAFKNIHLKDPLTGDPYIDNSHCTMKGFRPPVKMNRDNGRVLSAEYLEIAITDIDYEIIDKQYTWESDSIEWAMSARYGYLPQPLIDVVLKLYKAKTALKGIKGRELEYIHAKQEINACFGMMCQHPISNPIVFRNGEWKPDPKINREELYQKAIDKAFLSYAWAIWVTAWARYRLQEGIEIACKTSKRNWLYCDTDSVKGMGPLPDFRAYNSIRIRDAKRSGAYATDPKGEVHYMGVFENEGVYDLFCTLGAKRYCTVENGELEITVAGVPKEKGSAWLAEHGGIEAFKIDMIFPGSATGKLGCIYNDDVDQTITVDGHRLRITRNVVLVECDYRMTDQYNYQELRDGLQVILDNHNLSDYNGLW